MEPSVAVITTVAIDHTDWLGPDREHIGFEKAGIFRTAIPAVCGDANPPQSLLQRAAELQVDLKLIGNHYRIEARGDQWALYYADSELELPLPALTGEFQLANAATAIVALDLLPGLGCDQEAIRQGLQKVCLPGRFQVLRQNPAVIVDVAHNPQAAESLVAQLRAYQCAGKTLAVVAMLADKPVAEVIGLTAGEIDAWYTAGLESVQRGLAAADMAAAVEQQVSDVKLCAAATVSSACEMALAAADEEDRIIVFGSFHTVAEAMQFFARQG
jgi:dihydrofolate synthase/folylpolyglutamate synthase